MIDPISALTPRFAKALEAAFGPDLAGTSAAIRRSDRADFQADVAMGLAKKLGKPPREVAQQIVAHLDVGDLCEKVEVAGPGFVNLTLRLDAIAAGVADAARDPRLGVAHAAVTETVVVDYSAPNVAKEMHVGHLRSTIIGDALARVLEFLGHRVIRQNHLGDWGTPFGMLIEHLIDLGDGGEGRSIGDLSAFYKKAREKFDGDPAFAERSRHRVVLLQGGDAKTLGLWSRLVAESKVYFQAVYDRLGVTLTDADVYGESAYNPMLPSVVSDLEKAELVRVSEGAICAFPPGFSGKGGEPVPLIVRKQDGGYGYAATDLAAVRHRTTTLGATRLLYVVGAPQQQHLAMVFAVARLAGWLVPPTRAEHVSFGSILGTDKKMYKTRSGETVRLADLLDEAVERASAAVAAKNPDLDEATRSEVARMVGIAAVKYADLSNDRIKDYVFDWDRMLAFEGNTGPYLLYAHARIRSIFRRAQSEAAGSASATGAPLLRQPEERALALELLSFGAAIHEVSDSLNPHRLCGALFRLATTFTGFYEHCQVLKAEDDECRRSRLLLCDLTARTLRQGLSLLGIEAPERM